MVKYLQDKELCVDPDDLCVRLAELHKYNDNVISKLVIDRRGENPTISVILKSLERNFQIRTSTFAAFFPHDDEQSIFDQVLIDSQSSCNAEVKSLTNIFDQKNELMDFNVLLTKLKEKLRIDDDGLLDPTNEIRKYIYLKIGDGNNVNIDDHYFTAQRLFAKHDKFMTFFNLHGPSLVEYKNRNKHPFVEFFKDLVIQDWYWENEPSSRTSTYLKKEADKSKKKNYFLIRDGILRQDTYTLEVCLGVTGFVQKISLKDIEACKNYAKQLSKNGYTCLGKGTSCDYPTRTQINQESLSKQSSEEKEVKRNKKREEERKKKKKDKGDD